jgi:hypothetical protein
MMAFPTMFIVYIGMALLIALPIFAWAFRRSFLMNLIVDIVFLVYLVILCVGVFAKVDFDMTSTYIEWDFNQGWVNKTINFSVSNIEKTDMFLNLVMLVPIGVFVAYKSDCGDHVSFVILFFIGLMIGLGIELFQFVLPVPRSVQLSDVLLNSVSVCIGGFYGYIVNRITSIFRKD